MYFDTRDLRLTRWGISLRCRLGEGGTARRSGRWTVKLPTAIRGAATVRRELTLDAPPDAVPPAVAFLVLGHTRAAPLAPVACLRSERSRHVLRVHDRDIAEIDDDEVSVVEDGRVVLRFRELEVELLDHATAKTARRLATAVRAAGASLTDGTSKVARALGADVVGEPDIVVRPVTPAASLGEVTRAALASASAALLHDDPALRVGSDPGAVHRARVATRRLRSHLQTFATALDAASISTLRNELAWFGGALGAVRDADVLTARLERQIEGFDEVDRRGAAKLLERLAAEREEAEAALRASLGSDRYLHLLDALVLLAGRPPLLPEADRTAAGALGVIVDGRVRKLRRSVRDLGMEPDDGALHAVRIRAKRARYAAEASADVCGRPAKRLSKALAKLQTALGELNDAAVAERWLRRAGARSSGSPALAAGLLVATNRRDAVAARLAWRATWEGVERERRRWHS